MDIGIYINRGQDDIKIGHVYTIEHAKLFACAVLSVEKNVQAVIFKNFTTDQIHVYNTLKGLNDA